MNTISRNFLFFGLLFFSIGLHAKPGASVALLSPASYQLEPFSETQLNLKFSLPKKSGTLRIVTKLDGDVELSNQLNEQSYDLDGENTELGLPLTVRSGEAGRAYILFNVYLKDDSGKEEARALGIRLNIGEQVKQQKAASNKTVISLPAEETILH